MESMGKERPRPRRSFTPEFKAEIVELCRRGDRSVGQLVRDFQPDPAGLDARWCGDITYIPTGEGWLYLATVIDIASRRVVGWANADHLRTDLVADALRAACRQRRPTRPVIFHSDRGCTGPSASTASKARPRLPALENAPRPRKPRPSRRPCREHLRERRAEDPAVPVKHLFEGRRGGLAASCRCTEKPPVVLNFRSSSP